MDAANLSKRLADTLREMWSRTGRAQTLARIAVHRRQFENWWKFEVATHLWDFDDELYVFVECDKRADIVLARVKDVAGDLWIDDEHAPCIPIELKTVGTWWGTSPSAIRKALAEPGKKRLAADMQSARAFQRRADPFSAVALLITHEKSLGEKVLNDYVESALALGDVHGLPSPVLNEAIQLPMQHDRETTAQQILWIGPSNAFRRSPGSAGVAPCV